MLILEAAPNKCIVVCALHLNQHIWMGDLVSILYYAWAINHNKKQKKPLFIQLSLFIFYLSSSWRFQGISKYVEPISFSSPKLLYLLC